VYLSVLETVMEVFLCILTVGRLLFHYLISLAKAPRHHASCCNIGYL